MALVTEMKLKTSDTAFTDISPDEIRSYLSGGVKTGAIKGWLGTATVPTDKIYIAVHAIVYVKLVQV